MTDRDVPRGERAYRVGVVVSHPIQYQAPLFRHLARCPWLDLRVIYGCAENLRPSRSRDFGTTLQWDIPLLEGYQSEILENAGRGSPESLKYWAVSNPAMAERIRSGGFDAIWVHGWGFHSYWQAMRAA